MPLAAPPHPCSSSSVVLPPLPAPISASHLSNLNCSPCPASCHELPNPSLPNTVPCCFVSVIHHPPPSNLSQDHVPKPHSTPFSLPWQCCAQAEGESRGKGLVERRDRLPTCSSCAQASLMISHGGSITEMLFSVPVIGAS